MLVLLFIRIMWVLLALIALFGCGLMYYGFFSDLWAKCSDWCPSCIAIFGVFVIIGATLPAVGLVFVWLSDYVQQQLHK